MIDQRRAPTVEHGGEADTGAEMLRIGGNGEQCLRRRAEQQVIAAIGRSPAGPRAMPRSLSESLAPG